MILTRRNFMKISAGAAFLLGYPSLSHSLTQSNDRRLLVLLLRGGMDGVAAVPPLGDPALQQHRKSILVKDAEKLNDFFGIHPVLRFVKSEYKEDRAAIIHASSYPYTGRSHFEGQNVMEAGSLTPDVERTGWVGRAMAVAKLGSLTFSLPIPLILRGNENTFNHYPAKLSDAADVIYDKVLGDWSSDIGLRDTANELMIKRELGENSRSTSELMRFASDQMSRDDGPRVGLIDLVGFDTHALQGNEFGAQAKMLSQMDSLIRAFRAQMGSKWENTIVITVTEFGRTVSENGSKGTDHGYASCIFLVGGLVRKAQVVTDWPSLKSSNMFEGRDLMMTIDARDVYTEVISKVFSVDPKQVAKEVFFHHKVKRYFNILRNDGEPISKPLSNTSVEEISPYNTGVQSISDSSLCLFALNNEQSDYAETDSRKKYVKIAKSKGLSPFKCKELLDKGIDN